MDAFIAARSEVPPALIGNPVENLLPATGLLILVGKGGKGKTTLVLDLAFHLASGVAWLGFEVPHALRVLFVENEGPREPFRLKLQHKLDEWPHPISGGIFVYSKQWGQATLSDDQFVEDLNRFVGENTIDLVIADPLDSLGMEGVGSPAETRDMVTRLQRAGLFSTVAWLLPHHPRKGTVADVVDEVSGAWGGRPDTLLLLDKRRGNRAQLSFAKIRWTRRGERGPYLLGFEPETESFQLLQEEPAEGRDLVAEIQTLLAERPHLTAKEIAAQQGGIGANLDRVREALQANADCFTARTGEEAKALGRSASATLWERTRSPKSPESPGVPRSGSRAGDPLTPPLRESVGPPGATPTVPEAGSEPESAKSPHRAGSDDGEDDEPEARAGQVRHERGDLPGGGPSDLAARGLLGTVPPGHWNRWTRETADRIRAARPICRCTTGPLHETGNGGRCERCCGWPEEAEGD